MIAYLYEVHKIVNMSVPNVILVMSSSTEMMA